MIKILLRAWELIAWIQVFKHLISNLFARLLDQPQSQLPKAFEEITNPRDSFYEPSNFAFVELLEANWSFILSEQEQLDEQYFISLGESFSCQKGLKMFGLYADGLKIEENCRLCPATTRFIERIPTLSAASFLALAPAAQVVAHSKGLEGVLSCHLGLSIPEHCGIRIGEASQTWYKGKCLIFDNIAATEMWNQSDRPCVVLWLDF